MTPTKTYLLIGSVIVIVVVLLAYFFFHSSAPGSPATTNTQTSLPVATSTSSSFPLGSSGNPSSSNATSSSQIQLSAQGGSIVVNNFLQNGVTAADVVNPGNYYLAGSAGYCTKNGICPQGASTTNFIIKYDATQQFFTIALTQEPIGPARLDAEQFLITTLGISEQEMCHLHYYLGTTSYVNGTYAGKNLGFSFCPGATELPN